MREAVVVASSRTPLAKSHRGSFNMTRPDDLAADCIRHALAKVPDLDAAEIEEVILATLVMSSDHTRALGIPPLLVFRGYAIAGCELRRDGHRAGVRRAEIAEAAGSARRGHRRLGTERGVRLPGAVLPRHARDSDGPLQPERRLDRNRAPFRHDRLATGRDDRRRKMRRRGARYGVVTMCVGGGQGGAALFERM